jgi:hypothetical protein
MISEVTIRCDKCLFFFYAKTAVEGVSDQLSWAIPASGTTFCQMSKLFSLINVKLMDEGTYLHKKRYFDQFWTTESEELFGQNAAIEREMAVKSGRFVDGIPAICVKLDPVFGNKSLGRFNSGTCVVSIFVYLLRGARHVKYPFLIFFIRSRF